MPAPVGPAIPQNPKQKRTIYAVAGGGLLALIFLLSKRQAAAAATDGTTALQPVPTSTPVDTTQSSADLAGTIGDALAGQSQNISDALSGIPQSGTSFNAQDLAALGTLWQKFASHQPNNPAARNKPKHQKKKKHKKKTTHHYSNDPSDNPNIPDAAQ